MCEFVSSSCRTRTAADGRLGEEEADVHIGVNTPRVLCPGAADRGPPVLALRSAQPHCTVATAATRRHFLELERFGRSKGSQQSTDWQQASKFGVGQAQRHL